MKVEKGNFVVFNYVGKFEDGEIFDTSYEDIAKKAGIYVEDRKYGPIGANVGVGELIPGLDEALIGMEVGEKKTVTIPRNLDMECPGKILSLMFPVQILRMQG